MTSPTLDQRRHLTGPARHRAEPLARKTAHVDKARGRPWMVPAGPVRDHIRDLRRRGMSGAHIAEAAGVSNDCIYEIAAGGAVTTRREFAAAILAVRPSVSRANPRTGLLPGDGTRRRIQALMALGWRQSDVDAAAGLGRNMANRQLTRKRVTPNTAAAIRSAYDALSMRPGPSAITARRAVQAGYVPPLAWDDDTIDDPRARPRGAAR